MAKRLLKLEIMDQKCISPISGNKTVKIFGDFEAKRFSSAFNRAKQFAYIVSLTKNTFALSAKISAQVSPIEAPHF